jgi:uncharacterized protein
MTKFTGNMIDAAEKPPISIMATASKDGKPNGVPIGLAKIISDDEIMLVDNFMNKTRRNIEENPVVAISFWSAKTHGGGYQFKGKAKVETSGPVFDMAMQWLHTKTPPPPHTPKAVVIVKVDEIYHVGAHHDSDINLALR